MQKLGILGAGLGGISARILAALGSMSSLGDLNVQPGKPPKNHGRIIRSWANLNLTRSVKTSWPGQTELQREDRINAAQNKRDRKAEKLARDLGRSVMFNCAHRGTPRLDPFYIAR